MTHLSTLVGQHRAKQILARQAWSALNNPDEVASNLLLIGPTSVGKTEAIRRFAADCQCPLLEIQPQSCTNGNDLMDMIQAMQFYSHELVEYEKTGIFPRCVLFFDECHQMRSAIEQILLKATEPKDRILMSEDRRMIDTRRIIFAFATTDMGDLFDALLSRCVKVTLELYSQDEIAEIVKLNFPKWSLGVCKLIARYNPTIPREALAFARDMEIESEMTGNKDAVQVACKIASEHGIDELGMTKQRLAILTALGQSPISRSRLRHVAMVKDAELQRYILPPMLASLPDRPMPLVTVSNKGYTITPMGLKELDARNIPNNGSRAIPQAIRTLFPMDEPHEAASDSEGLREAGIVEFKRQA